VAWCARVAVGPCERTSRIEKTINTSSGSSGGPIQRAMPIQKAKFFFVKVTDSETKGWRLVGLTTHRTSPCSSGFSLRGREIGSLRRGATGAPALGEVRSPGRSVHVELGRVDILKSYATSRSRSRSRMHPSLRSSLSRSLMRALSSGGMSPASGINEAYSSSSSRTFLGSVRIKLKLPFASASTLLTVKQVQCLCGKMSRCSSGPMTQRCSVATASGKTPRTSQATRHDETNWLFREGNDIARSSLATSSTLLSRNSSLPRPRLPNVFDRRDRQRGATLCNARSRRRRWASSSSPTRSRKNVSLPEKCERDRRRRTDTGLVSGVLRPEIS
jgi:hypothetical protein